MQVPLPEVGELEQALEVLSDECPVALQDFQTDLNKPARRLTGATLSAVEGMLKRREFEKRPLHEGDLAELKKSGERERAEAKKEDWAG